jgi:hypothetical protein
MRLSRRRKGVGIPSPAVRPSFSFRVVGNDRRPVRRTGRRNLSTGDSISRKKNEGPRGPVDRVERSSPAIRSPTSPPWRERLTSQTGVPPPHTGQSEMKPSWALSADAGPPGVLRLSKSRIAPGRASGDAQTSAGVPSRWRCRDGSFKQTAQEAPAASGSLCGWAANRGRARGLAGADRAQAAPRADAAVRHAGA